MNEDTVPQEQTQMTPEQPRKKRLAQMSEEERKEYDRQAKRRSREKARLEKQKLLTPSCEDYEQPAGQAQELWQHSQQVLAHVKSETSHAFTLEDDRVVSQMAQVLLAHKEHWLQRVHCPFSVLYGGIFIDATVSDAIHLAHRAPELLSSPTFSGLYQELLRVTQKLSQNSWFDPGAAEDIDLELAGKFKLPPEPVIPKAEPEPDISIEHFRESSRVPASRIPTAQDKEYYNNPLAQSLPPEARLFLDSGTFGGGPR